ncbi:MAG: hypothetical protein KAV87_46615 [Desulfobacteraceae bacterium]|nr:hypothetical protein [Desulfobacteraceae bacterium]
MSDEEVTNHRDSPPPVEKTGWRTSEGQNKCLLSGRQNVVVTSEMEDRKVEVSRQLMAGFICVTYYDPITEVYWIEKLGAPASEG